MKTIYKYPVSFGEGVTHCIPNPGQIIAVGEQGGTVCVWILVDTKEAVRPVTFRIIGTGWELPDGIGRPIGTVFIGPYVWHVFSTSKGKL